MLVSGDFSCGGLFTTQPPRHLWLLSLKMLGSSNCIANSISSFPPPYRLMSPPYTWMFLWQRHPPTFTHLPHLFYLCFVYPPVCSSAIFPPSFSLPHPSLALTLSCLSIYSTLAVGLAAPVCSVGAWKQIPWRTCSGISSAMITPDPFHAELGKQSKPHFVCHIFSERKEKTSR